jgi:hypothetical protein
MVAAAAAAHRLQQLSNPSAGQQQPVATARSQQPQQPLTVQQQADLLIRQATSIDRLAQMFEGWMPWL